MDILKSFDGRYTLLSLCRNYTLSLVRSLSTVTRLWAGWLRNCGAILVRSKSFSLFWSFCTGSGAHCLSCWRGLWWPISLGVKWLGWKLATQCHLVLKLGMLWVIPQCFHMLQKLEISSWSRIFIYFSRPRGLNTLDMNWLLFVVTCNETYWLVYYKCLTCTNLCTCFKLY